jgi:hypothetical protein
LYSLSLFEVSDYVPINVNDAVHGGPEGGGSRDEHQCMRPLSDQDLVQFVRRTRAANHFRPALPSSSGADESTSSSNNNNNNNDVRESL